MEIISIEKKTFEELVLRLGRFVKRMDSINRQRSSRRMSDWMDGSDSHTLKYTLHSDVFSAKIYTFAKNYIL